MDRIKHFFRGDLLFTFSALFAGIAAIVGRWSWQDIDWKVIVSLFGLMAVINGLEMTGLLAYAGEFLVQKSKTTRELIRAVVLLSFFSSMLLTNDVAILTLLPIYLMMTKKLQNRKTVMVGGVLIIIAANLGSSFFPFGNPQNLFLFSYYKIPVIDFFLTTGALSSVSLVTLLVFIHFLPKERLVPEIVGRHFDKRAAYFFSFLMLLMVLGIFNLIPYWLAFVIVSICIIIKQPSLFQRVDYRLLLTFVSFFVIVGNISQLPRMTQLMTQWLTSDKRTFVGSVLVSQVISNVPTAILMAPFTKFHSAVLVGVNVGGLGTLIASLANLIGYKLVKLSSPSDQRIFMKLFTLLNFGLLLIVFFIFYFVV